MTEVKELLELQNQIDGPQTLNNLGAEAAGWKKEKTAPYLWLKPKRGEQLHVTSSWYRKPPSFYVLDTLVEAERKARLHIQGTPRCRVWRDTVDEVLNAAAEEGSITSVTYLTMASRLRMIAFVMTMRRLSEVEPEND